MNCELLTGARILAARRGLPLNEVTCPVPDICMGEFCIYLDDDEEVDSMAVEKFYARLEKHFEKKGIIFERTNPELFDITPP